MKKITLLITLLFVLSYAYSQVGGLSASKLGTLCSSTVPNSTIEFEPFFGYAQSTNYFDSDGEIKSLFSTSDSTMNFAGSGFRFTYGLAKNLELGVSIPVNVNEIHFGAKYQLPIEGNYSFGLLAGYNTIMGNQIFANRDGVNEATPGFVGGIIISYVFSDKLSIDFDAQYQKQIQTTVEGHKQGFYLNSDIGYYLMKKINFIIGLNYGYQAYNTNIDDSYLLTLNTGVAIEKAKNFILVINAPFDILGKNEYQTKGFGLALTTFLD